MKYLISIKLSAGILATGIFLMLSACAEKEDPPIVPSTPVLTDPDLPQELLTEIFTPDIPEKIRNVDEFLNRIESKGMKIHRDTIPTQSAPSLPRYTFRNVCIYDETNEDNIGFEFGSYVESMSVSFNQVINRYEVTNIFSSKGNDLFPSYPDSTDYGSGKGIIVGNGNEFSNFIRIDGNFQEVRYKAIWIVSYTVEFWQSGVPRVAKNVTKCLVMVSKDPDPEGKVASVGAVRIFKDDAPEMGG